MTKTRSKGPAGLIESHKQRSSISTPSLLRGSRLSYILLSFAGLKLFIDRVELNLHRFAAKLGIQDLRDLQ